MEKFTKEKLDKLIETYSKPIPYKKPQMFVHKALLEELYNRGGIKEIESLGKHYDFTTNIEGSKYLNSLMQEETKLPEEVQSNPLEDLLLKFEDSTEEAKEAIIQQIEIDKKKLVLNKYVESLKGMSRRHIIRAMKRKAKELGLNEIEDVQNKA